MPVWRWRWNSGYYRGLPLVVCAHHTGVSPVSRPRSSGGVCSAATVIRARRDLAGNLQDLAMFNLAIKSKLRGCDLVRLKVADLIVRDSVRGRVAII